MKPIADKIWYNIDYQYSGKEDMWHIVFNQTSSIIWRYVHKQLPLRNQLNNMINNIEDVMNDTN